MVDLVLEKLPVSISLGLWTTLLTYLISIPLGIRKAVRDGTRFDVWTSAVVIVGNAIPGFLFAVLLIVLFAGGSYFDWFPLRGLVSDNWQRAVLAGADPRLSLAHGAADHRAGDRRASPALTMLTKNSFLDEINKQYVMTARAKGLTRAARALRPRVPQRHADRDRRLPGAFIGILFTGALLIEMIFSLDGLGPARLRGGAQPRLPGDVRHALRLHADRPA